MCELFCNAKTVEPSVVVGRREVLSGSDHGPSKGHGERGGVTKEEGQEGRGWTVVV